MLTSEKQLKLAYGLAIVLFVVGVLSYGIAAVSPPSSDRPVRLMFNTSAGKVFFDHKTHADISGYGISCGDCHHTLAEDEYEDATSCSECHEAEAEEGDVPKRADAFHQQCAGCHQEFGKGPEQDACASCHIM